VAHSACDLGAEDILHFPAQLKTVQVDDNSSLVAMGRGAVAITVQSNAGHSVRLVTTHLKSKLLTFPGGRFQPHDEDERTRFAAYALYRRAAEAATLRASVSAALGGVGEKRVLILIGDLNDAVQAATTQLLLGPPGSEIHTAGFDQPDQGDHQPALEPCTADAGGQRLLASQSGSQRADRPHPYLCRTRQADRCDHGCRGHSTASAFHRDQPTLASTHQLPTTRRSSRRSPTSEADLT
jgi:endonuclease/exonuclease/phosphatase family metal-dependent hydrolase